MAWSMARLDLESRRDALQRDLNEVMASIQAPNESMPSESAPDANSTTSADGEDLQQLARDMSEQLRHINAHLAVLED